MLYVNEHKREQTGLYDEMKIPLYRSISRSGPATSVKGFPRYRYAVFRRGSCLRSERSLSKCSFQAIYFLLVSKKLCISNTETTTVPYIEFDREYEEYHGCTPSEKCTVGHSSISEGQYIFQSLLLHVRTIIRDRATLKCTSSQYSMGKFMH